MINITIYIRRDSSDGMYEVCGKRGRHATLTSAKKAAKATRATRKAVIPGGWILFELRKEKAR